MDDLEKLSNYGTQGIRRRQTKQKHNTICVGHRYTHTNNVNKTWTLLQATGGKDESNKHK